jgi:Ribonuclease G/E
MTRVLAVTSPGEVRVLAEQDGTLLDYAIWRPGRPDGVGDLHRGRVQAKVQQMAGAFVLIEGATGFLPDSEGGTAATEGETLTVRVTRAAQGGKGPRLTALLTPDEVEAAGSAPATQLLRRGPGAVERLVALYPDAPVLADDPALVAALRPRFGARIAVGRDLPGDHLMEQIETLSAPDALLPGGLRASIYPTPALVAVDIDTAGATAGRQSKHSALLALNRAALPALAAQIRLRNLSGAILIDLAGLSPKRRVTLAPDLAAALATDPLRPRLLGFTQLGFAELVRSRVHPPLHELLRGPHAAGLAALHALERAGIARLRAAPDVAAAIEGDPVARGDFARRTGHALMLRVDPTLAACGWVLES